MKWEEHPRRLAANLWVARCVAGVVEDEASLRAASLAYSLIFCAAPLGAMLLGLAALFPDAFSFLPSLYELAGERVLPAALEDAALALRSFADNAGHLSLASLGLSLVSAVFLSMQLEQCVLACWGLRPALDQPSYAWARHILALALIPCSMALLGWAASQSLDLSGRAGGAFASLGMLFAFFVIATWALPEARPSFRVACAASALAAIECGFIQAGFGLVWERSKSYGAIYGAAAVFLGALMWIWLFWLSLLTSVSICATLLLRRPRDARAQGMEFLHRGLSPPTEPQSPQAQEAELIDQLALDPQVADPEAYRRLLGTRLDLAAKREALGGACAARLLRAMIESTPDDQGLAKHGQPDNLSTPPPS